MDRRKSDTVKFWASIILPIIAISVAYMTLSHRQEITTKTEQKARERLYNDLNIQQQLLKDDVLEIKTKLDVLDSSDDKNSMAINRIKDSLVVFPTKEEVNAKFGNFSTTLKTDMMGVNSWLQIFNQRISHMEGSWQQWNINYYRSVPVVTTSISDNSPETQEIYDTQRYK